MPRRYVLKGGNAGRPKKPRNPGGRPTKYDSRLDEIAGNFARMGYCDYEIAEKLEIAIPTFYDWCKKFPVFSKSIKEGRSQSMTGMAFKAVLKALEGGQKKKTKVVRVKDSEGRISEIREEEYVEEVWPCKDTAFKHLTATVPEYAGIKDNVDKAPLVEALENVDRIVEKLKDSNGTDQEAASLDS